MIRRISFTALFVFMMSILLYTAVSAQNISIKCDVKNETSKPEVSTTVSENNNSSYAGVTKAVYTEISKELGSNYSGVNKEVSKLITTSYAVAEINVIKNNADVVGSGRVAVDNLIRYTSTDLNLRTTPSKDSDIISVLPTGTEVKVTATVMNNDWAEVYTKDASGFVLLKYLTDQSPLTYIGKYKLTYYSNTVRSCGAVGRKCADTINYPVEGVTIAADPSIPFGTKLLINGNVYTVQDRGGAIKGKVLDVFINGTDQDCFNLGIKYADVYIVNN